MCDVNKASGADVPIAGVGWCRLPVVVPVGDVGALVGAVAGARLGVDAERSGRRRVMRLALAGGCDAPHCGHHRELLRRAAAWRPLPETTQSALLQHCSTSIFFIFVLSASGESASDFCNDCRNKNVFNLDL